MSISKYEGAELMHEKAMLSGMYWTIFMEGERIGHGGTLNNRGKIEALLAFGSENESNKAVIKVVALLLDVEEDWL